MKTNTRRNFIIGIDVSSVALNSHTSFGLSANTTSRPNGLPIYNNVDICVLGGSCIGVFAAVRDSKLGARVALLKNKMPSMNRSYLFADNTPIFPFGYGLSYAKFEYSNPELSSPVITQGSTTTLKVNINNTGSVVGTEVVQLYINDEISSVRGQLFSLKILNE